MISDFFFCTKSISIDLQRSQISRSQTSSIVLNLNYRELFFLSISYFSVQFSEIHCGWYSGTWDANFRRRISPHRASLVGLSLWFMSLFCSILFISVWHNLISLSGRRTWLSPSSRHNLIVCLARNLGECLCIRRWKYL